MVFSRLKKNCWPEIYLKATLKFVWSQILVGEKNQSHLKWLPVDGFFFCKTDNILCSINRAYYKKYDTLSRHLN